MKQTILILLLVLFAILTLRPLPKASIDTCVQHSGRGSVVLKGDGEGDIVIKLKNNRNYFYINRAIDNGLSVDGLHELIAGNEIELLTIQHWTPLDPMSKTKHIAQIKINGTIIYTEL